MKQVIMVNFYNLIAMHRTFTVFLLFRFTDAAGETILNSSKFYFKTQHFDSNHR